MIRVNKRVRWSALILVLLGAMSWLFIQVKSKPSAPVEVSAPASAAVSSVSSFIAGNEEDAPADDESADEKKQKLALFFGKDDRVFIPSPYTGSYAAIGKLQTEAESHCTATLVAPDLAVTAAHCFLMQPRKLDKGKWFWAGYYEGKWQARYQVLGQVFHPRFRKGLEYKGDDVYIQPKVAAYDIAWLKLKLLDGIAPQPMPLFSGNADTLLAQIQQFDSKVTQAGFAHDHNQKLTAHQGCQVTSLVDNNTLEHQCDTLAGDSGSPLWLETGSGPLLIAVQSAAPDWFNRDKSDNTAVTVLQLPKRPQ